MAALRPSGRKGEDAHLLPETISEEPPVPNSSLQATSIGAQKSAFLPTSSPAKIHGDPSKETALPEQLEMAFCRERLIDTSDANHSKLLEYKKQDSQQCKPSDSLEASENHISKPQKLDRALLASSRSSIQGLTEQGQQKFAIEVEVSSMGQEPEEDGLNDRCVETVPEEAAAFSDKLKIAGQEKQLEAASPKRPAKQSLEQAHRVPLPADCSSLKAAESQGNQANQGQQKSPAVARQGQESHVLAANLAECAVSPALPALPAPQRKERQSISRPASGSAVRKTASQQQFSGKAQNKEEGVGVSLHSDSHKTSKGKIQTEKSVTYLQAEIQTNQVKQYLTNAEALEKGLPMIQSEMAAQADKEILEASTKELSSRETASFPSSFAKSAAIENLNKSSDKTASAKSFTTLAKETKAMPLSCKKLTDDGVANSKRQPTEGRLSTSSSRKRSAGDSLAAIAIDRHGSIELPKPTRRADLHVKAMEDQNPFLSNMHQRKKRATFQLTPLQATRQGDP